VTRAAGKIREIHMEFTRFFVQFLHFIQNPYTAGGNNPVILRLIDRVSPPLNPTGHSPVNLSPDQNFPENFACGNSDVIRRIVHP
jgi:hypothetical protein